MRLAKRIGIIILGIVLLLLIILGIWGFVLPSIRLGKLEKLSMDDSVTAKYSGQYLADEDTIYSYVQDLFDMGARLAGTEAGAKAQTYVKDKFTEFGLTDVDIIPSKTKLYTCNQYSFLLNGESKDCSYINYSRNDGTYGDFEADVTGEMVYVGTDTKSKEDVKGKIVVADIGFQSIPYVACNYIGYLKYDPNHTIGLTDTKDVVYIGDAFSDSYFYYMEQGAAGFIGILADYYDTSEYDDYKRDF